MPRRRSTIREVLLLCALVAQAAPARAHRRPPPQVRLDPRILADLPLRPDVAVPLSAPLAMPVDLELDVCREALASPAGACRVGDVVVIAARGLIAPAGRCERQEPARGRAYALLPGAFEQALARIAALPGHSDRFDAVVFWSAFPQTYLETVPEGESQPCPLAYRLGLPHPDNGGEVVAVRGIGKAYNPPPDGRRLRAVIDLWSLGDWPDDRELLRDDLAERPLNILAHETEHAVCCYVSFTDREVGGAISDRLLGHGGEHWSFYLHTGGQLLYGANWEPQGDGSFRSLAPRLGLRPLDLYLWGLIPAAEVPRLTLIDTERSPCAVDATRREAVVRDCGAMRLGQQGSTTCAEELDRCLAAFDHCLDPPYKAHGEGRCSPYRAQTVQAPVGVVARGRAKPVTIDDVVAASGPRLPAHDAAPKARHQLTALLVAEPAALTLAALERLERFRLAFAAHLYRITGQRMRHVGRWDGRDDLPRWGWGGRPDWPADSELEGWQGESLARPLALLVPDGLALRLRDGASGIVNPKVAIDGRRVDLLRLTVRLPPVIDDRGEPLRPRGLLLLEGPGGASATIELPLLADGRWRTVTLLADELGGARYDRLTLRPATGEAAGALAALDEPVLIDELALIPLAELADDPAAGRDDDGDRVPAAVDNCPSVSNPHQLDADGDGLGDACEEEPPPAPPPGDQAGCSCGLSGGAAGSPALSLLLLGLLGLLAARPRRWYGAPRGAARPCTTRSSTTT